MDSECYLCVKCQLPVLEDMDCLSVWIQEGKRKEETIRIGVCKEDGEIEFSHATRKYSSQDLLNKATVKTAEYSQQSWNIYSFTEKGAQTGLSYWHLHCLEKEMDVSFFIEREIEKIKREATIFYKKNGYIDEIYQKRINEVREKKDDFLQNALLNEKWRNYSFWNQNMISKKGEFEGKDVYGNLIEKLEEIKEFRSFYPLEESIEGALTKDESEKLIQLLTDIDLPKELLKKVLERKHG